ncbi:unnamed protein product [Spirodela intermedia]|uniref:Long-chain-alcohol oxidase n=1 Tax=Spirodela intermedia TaxID=51605 RepID=A0A7I8JSU7_SPIIN|nr:unnamed protein product [Spirodela intermedia]CAA6673246.1 unnamed protein product [Spirodela intermedia]CAA6674072.1 unnamed protein product [Spirodela intermedia]
MATLGTGLEEKDIPAEVVRLAALLQGGRPPRPCPLTPRQLESLAAFCDTLIPSVEVPGGVASDEDLARFYGTSASMATVPGHIAGLITKKHLHPELPLLPIMLWLLSTWCGTFAICGGASLSTSFPYFRKFSEVEEPRREEILMKLSRSCFGIKRLLFRSLKILTVRLYFQRADEMNGNPSWKAIGYCGRDPELPTLDDQRRRTAPVDEASERLFPNPQLMGPLYQALVDMSGPEQPQLQSTPRARLSRRRQWLPLTLQCDAVVVGSGSGGSVVAGVLANAGYRVIVLDKGRYFPTATLSLLEGPSHEQMYEKGGMVSSDDLGILVLAGATVGGGSAVNWSASIRTPDTCSTTSLPRSTGGCVRPPWGQSLDISWHPAERLSSAVLRRGCSTLGYPVVNIPVNAPPGHDCGWCHLGCKDGKKKSTLETWLADMTASGNGVILAGCRAVKVTTSRQKGGRRPYGEVVVKSKVTVVACGALNTPGFLRRSGLKNPNIGRHLHLHPTVMAWGYFPDEITSDGWLGPEKKSYIGELLTTMSHHPDPGAAPGAFAAVTPWTSSADFRRRMIRFPRTATLFALARDRGSGCSRKYPASLSYKLDAADEKTLQQGMERMLRILAAAGAEEVGTHHRDGRCSSYVRRASGRGLRDSATPISTAHQMGSCRMGMDPRTSAVNENGETWEVGRLFVADTSVFPTALGINPMVTVQAIAYCTAQNILEVLQASSG